MPQDTQSLIALFTEFWNTGKLELAAQLYSPDSERIDPNQQPARGIQGIANEVAIIHAGFPDFKIDITRTIADSDQIATEWTCSGTHHGEYQGVPPTGRRVSINGTTIQRTKGGLILDEHVYFDRLSLLQQLGAIPAASQPASAARF